MYTGNKEDVYKVQYTYASSFHLNISICFILLSLFLDLFSSFPLFFCFLSLSLYLSFSLCFYLSLFLPLSLPFSLSHSLSLFCLFFSLTLSLSRSLYLTLTLTLFLSLLLSLSLFLSLPSLSQSTSLILVKIVLSGIYQLQLLKTWRSLNLLCSSCGVLIGWVRRVNVLWRYSRRSSAGKLHVTLTGKSSCVHAFFIEDSILTFPIHS